MRESSVIDSVANAPPAIDPWSLGPDVFQNTREDQPIGALMMPRNEKTYLEIKPLDTNGVGQIGGFETVRKDTVRLIEHSQSSGDSSHDNTALNIPEESTSSVQLIPIDGVHSATTYTVQLGTFIDRTRAQEFHDRASAALGIKGVLQVDWPFFRLRFGNFLLRESADSLQSVAMSKGFYDARVLKSIKSQ